ncbi:unnamed protein product [Brassica rapa]|uniref:Uncharacterized protein n=2 Tax=Brassica TaxID=3705 RepID=A0A8D9HYJ5_BRACM|nr:unnamed protein product [Brassica napus]CAG7905929.1 unnamed protein product [Brassica rapa]
MIVSYSSILNMKDFGQINGIEQNSCLRSFEVPRSCLLQLKIWQQWVRMGMAFGVRELEIPHCEEDFEEYTSFKLLKTLYTNEKLQVLKPTYTVTLDVLKPTYTVTLDVPLYTQGSTVFKCIVSHQTMSP